MEKKEFKAWKADIIDKEEVMQALNKMGRRRLEVLQQQLREGKEVEALAARLHEIWTRWYRHQHETFDGWYNTGKYVPNVERLKRWEQQAATSYEGLSEEDKEKDRVLARELLATIGDHVTMIELGTFLGNNRRHGYTPLQDLLYLVQKHEVVLAERDDLLKENAYLDNCRKHAEASAVEASIASITSDEGSEKELARKKELLDDVRRSLQMLSKDYRGYNSLPQSTVPLAKIDEIIERITKDGGT